MIPTLNRILVTPPAAEATEEKSRGGLYIPQQAREASKFVQGRVISVGPDVKSIKAGDEVLYNREQSHEISAEGVTAAVLIEDKHVAVVL